MRILHVLASVDADARRPGEVSACVEQCGELVRRGHEVDIVLGWRGRRAAPTTLGGLPVAGVRLGGPDRHSTSPGTRALLRRLRRDAAGYDLAHLHGLGDPVVAAAARVLRRADVPYVVQPGSGAVPTSWRWGRLGLDPVVTALRGADHLLPASARQEADLRTLVGTAPPSRVLPHGVRPASAPLGPRAGRDTDPSRRDVLLLAPLAPGRPVMAFARAAALLIDDGVAADFCVVGPDLGARSELLLFIGTRPQLADHLRYEGPLRYDAATARLANADIFVATAPDDACPVGLLEALAAGLPVVYAGDDPLSTGLPALRVAADPTPESLAGALRVLIDDDERRLRGGERSLSAAAGTFSAGPVVDELLEVYRSVRPRRPAARRVPEPRRAEQVAGRRHHRFLHPLRGPR